MNKEEIKQNVKDGLDKAKFKLHAAGEKAKEKTKEVVGWCAEHPGETIAGLTAAGAVLTGVNKLATKAERRRRDREEEHRRLCEKYDPVTHSWVELKRPMTAKENVEFAERRQAGESAIMILDSMRLIKK